MKSERIGSPPLKLRAGEWVEVRSKEEILATLDASGRLENLPFMPEMFQYCGRKLMVFRRAHKTCDTVNSTGGRSMLNAVHLNEIRCDGAAHGGCEAACLIFWKDAWLKRTSAPSSLLSIGRRPRQAESNGVPKCSAKCTEAALHEATRTPESRRSDTPSYVCQATALPGATRLLPWWDVRQYVEDYTSGNAPLTVMLSSFAYVGFFKVVKLGDRSGLRLGTPLIRAYDAFQKLIGGIPFPEKHGTHPVGTDFPPCSFGVSPGDSVRVKSQDEILDTLDQANRNRGMYFGAEEVRYCGKTFRVKSSVKSIVHEQTGRMIKLRGKSFILDGVICGGHYTDRRLFCPRAIYPFWREAWLEPVDAATSKGP